MNPFRIGDLVTESEAKRFNKRTIHTVTRVEGNFVWVDNQHYQIDAINYKYCILVTLTFPGEIKR